MYIGFRCRAFQRVFEILEYGFEIEVVLQRLVESIAPCKGPTCDAGALR